MALPEIKQTATEARLAALSLPTSGCTKPAREAAIARVREMGPPDRRDEYWKYTRPDTLVQAEAPKAALFESGEAMMFDQVDRLKIVFVDGVFDAEASDDLSLEGVKIERLEDICCTDIHWAKDLYGVLETRGHTPVPRPLAALNTAFAADGVAIHVTGKVSKPISLIYIHKDEASDAFLHHIIRVESGAEATILENGPAAARFNKCMEIDIADGGKLHHVRAQGRDHERRAVTHMFTRLGTESVYKSFTLTVNGVLTRNEQVIELLGDDAVAHVAGACVGDGDFHHDDTVFITHDAVNCESRQVFKKVLRNGATGVFQGKILVKEGAQKTDGYQISASRCCWMTTASSSPSPSLRSMPTTWPVRTARPRARLTRRLCSICAHAVCRWPMLTDLLTLAFLAEAVEEIEDDRAGGRYCRPPRRLAGAAR